ncbi:dephospho-CoA kinase [Microlunatus antarcticus]|uniref:Dephospho-CoA kinase n=1 Tax=Microlunatus antarcticus TaxID=53388 RepID=A0A7W5P861_9ACTN|nr:dephospho-CoA kinase [Microlunatus antarcticus]MBB3328220.1 dephospho-CoA kinase [Microlunatus antarcticus]
MTAARARRIGLTGGIASGKSTVATLLEERGALVVDADVLAREVVEPGTPGLAAVVDRFGPTVLTPDGRLDRAALGRLVFSGDAAGSARRDLEAVVHPAVRARAAELEAGAQPGQAVVHVIPLLVETGQADAFDLVVVVDVPEDVQRARLLARGGLAEAEADARIAAQATRAARLAAADVVLDNAGDRDDLVRHVEELWARIGPR